MGSAVSVPVFTGLAVVGAVASLVLLGLRGHKHNVIRELTTDLSGKTVVVTGANTGIGFWTAQDFAARHARVILGCRSLERGETARKQIVAATGNRNVVVCHLDLFDFTSVRQFADEIKQNEECLHILVNNAGIFFRGFQSSEHGLDMTMATNYLGPYLLTRLLIGLLKKSAPSRIINVSSSAHRMAKNGIDFDYLRGEKTLKRFDAYACTKLGNLLFTRELASRLADTGITTYCVHPGMVATEIWRNLPHILKMIVKLYFFFKMDKSAEKGAETVIFVSVAEEGDLESGKYYIDCALAEDKVNPWANDTSLAKKLWMVSAELTGVPEDVGFD